MVVDYRPIEKLLTEKAKQCPPFADERCTGLGAGATVGSGYWRTDVRGALVWASWQIMQRDAKVTHYMWNFIDLIEGHQLQLTNNADKSRTFVAIYMHDNRLLHLRRHGTEPATRRPASSAVTGLRRQGRQRRSLYRLLRQRLPAAPARAGGSRCWPGARAGEVTGGGDDESEPPSGDCEFAVLVRVMRDRSRAPRITRMETTADNFIDLQGTVKEVHLLNPHSWVYLDVRNTSGSRRRGRSRRRTGSVSNASVSPSDTVKPGETVKVRCHPLRDGSRGCLLGFLKTKDGEVKDWDGNRLPIPADF